MRVVTISSKNQITLPRDLLTAISATSSGKLIIDIDKQSDRIVLKTLKTSLVEESAGSLTAYISKNKLNKTFTEIQNVTKRSVAKKLAGK